MSPSGLLMTRPTPPLPPCGARDVARLARRLLGYYGETFMRIALERGADGEDDVRCGFMAADFASQDDVPPACDTSAELPVHAALLLRDLRAVWPDAMRPAAVAMITDGHGVAFCPDMPAMTGADWLRDIVLGNKAWLALAPFPANSPWIMMTASLPGARH